MAEFDPSRAAESFAQLAEDFERRAGRFQELQERMTALTVTESSGGGRVSVTVDSNGVPTAINLSAGSRGQDPAVLSAEIMSCMRQAQSTLRTQVTELVQHTVGADEAGATIIDQFAQRFPDPGPDPVAPSGYSASPPSGNTPPSVPSASSPAQSPTSSDASLSRSRNRKPDRDQIVVPDEPDADDEYYNRKTWLI
ncbi:YbaB/EbfC family nucleoid-associated protein [Nocardia sp. NPDC049220]|uniref:YbaB/EbfC family nucleoid-associated protein n=1 Tax=Nocardia sp. NPDC049220 TaxID=3155273 RepID=UPI0033E0FB93